MGIRSIAGVTLAMALTACSPPGGNGEDPCDGVNCGNGMCDVQGNVAVCVCMEGYHADGLTCVEDPEGCNSNSCSGHGTCTAGDDGVSCECQEGYAGDRCNQCDDGYHAEGGASGGVGDCVPDENPCDPDPCDAADCGHGTCACVAGEARCTCNPGYDGDACDECDDDYHELDPGACVPCNVLRFTYADSGASSVWLTGTFTGWAATVEAGAIAMTNEGGTWTVDATIEPGGRHLYKFVVNGITWVADPSNPLSEDDGFGGQNSVLENVCVFGGATGSCGDVEAVDWRDVVMYFVMTDRFFDSDASRQTVPGATDGPADGPSGQYMGGDLAGVAERIAYLNDLGVTAIWLSAPYENRDTAGAAIDTSADSHMYSGYHGYWPSPANIDYSDPANPSPTPEVESRIGDAADLHALIDEAHGTTSANGEGIRVLFDYVMKHVDTESGFYAAHHDWFIPDDDGSGFDLCGPENHWEDEYWMTRCAFTDYLAPLDFYNPAVRAWSVSDAVWWATEFEIDGFRLDAIKHVPLDWLEELRAELTSQFPDPWGERFYLVGETFAYDDAGLIRTFVDPDTLLDGQFDFPWKARVCEAVFTEGGGLNHLSTWMDGNDGFYGEDAIMTTWIGNHDIPRAIHFASRQITDCRQGSYPGNGWDGASYQQPTDAAPYERLGVAFAIMMTNRGIPLIYYGDEIGLAGGGDPDNRRMMVFDDADLNAHQIALRDAVSALAHARATHPALSRGTRTTHAVSQNTWVYTMGGCGDTPDVTVAINRADAAANVEIPAGSYTDLIAAEPASGGSTSLPARSFLVLAHDDD